MEYYERERIIAECRRKLPYPISFYDKLNDGSLWNVYNKHVVNNIPINKKAQKAKVENDQARIAEQEGKRAKAIEAQVSQTPKKTAQTLQEEYEQLTLEEYYASLQPSKPKLLRSQGCFWRLNDAGEYDYVPDSEMVDVIEAFGAPTMIDDEEVQDIGAPKLVLRRN